MLSNGRPEVKGKSSKGQGVFSVQNEAGSRRRGSQSNPLYTPADDDVVFISTASDNTGKSLDNNHGQAVRKNSTTDGLPFLRPNSIYELSSSTQVRIPSQSSESSDEFAAVFTRNQSRDSLFKTPTNQSKGSRKASVPTVKVKNKSMKSQRSASVPNRLSGPKCKDKSSSKKNKKLSPIKETQNSRRYTRQSSLEATPFPQLIGAPQNAPVNVNNVMTSEDYVRQLVVTNGAVGNTTGVHGRSTHALYSVT